MNFLNNVVVSIRQSMTGYDSFDDSSTWPETLRGNESILSSQEKELVKLLLNNDQQHLFQEWDPLGVQDEEKHRFFAQVERLHSSYPSRGGLGDYLKNAKNLLESSKIGANPLEGWTPDVPSGVIIDPLADTCLEHEKLGLTEIGKVGFVLVAGGLGERLGYSGIKVELPSETTTHTGYLQLYCESILSIQKRYASRKLPLAIMVSDDTFVKTDALLRANNFFGLDEDQVTLMKQEKVAALLDNVAHIATVSKYEIDSKPHGHGDVHALLHSTGTASKWLDQGLEWIFFFQDTNGLAFYTLAAQLGVSISLDLEVNSMAIPRVAKQAVGAISSLTHSDGRSMTVNVEYNQLEPLLIATGSTAGDVNESSGYSKFPGNINQLLFRLAPYCLNLSKHSGIMSEFVNPKYSNPDRTVFKKPTRLECMMQDYPKILSNDAKVGFTMAPAWICFSPCKNNSTDAAAAVASGIPANSAWTAESDQYFVGAELLRRLGASVASAGPLSIQGITAIPGPQIVFKPSFALFPYELLSRFPNPEMIEISSSSTLVLEGDIDVRTLKLDGSLKVKAQEGTRIVVVAGLKQGGVSNGGQVMKIPPATDREVDLMRGYIFMTRKDEVVVSPEVVYNDLMSSDAKESYGPAVFVYNGRGLIPGNAYEDEDFNSSTCATCWGVLG